MSLAAMNWAWKQTLPMGPKMVLVALSDRADERGVCWPGIANLAERCGCSERSVRRYLAELLKLAAVRRLPRRAANGTQRSNLYVLAVPGAPRERVEEPPDVPDVEGLLREAGFDLSPEPPADSVTGGEIPHPTQNFDRPNRELDPAQAPESPAVSLSPITVSTESKESSYDAGAREAAAESGPEPTRPAPFPVLMTELGGCGWDIAQVQTAAVVRMVRRWAEVGVTPLQVRDAVQVCKGRRGGVLPTSPTYLRAIVEDLRRPEPARSQSHETDRTHGHQRRAGSEAREQADAAFRAVIPPFDPDFDWYADG